MANIPLGDFAMARSVPQSSPSRLDMRSMDAGRGHAALAQGLDDVSRVAQGIAEQRQNEEAGIAIAQAQVANLKYQNDVESAMDESRAEYAVPQADLSKYEQRIDERLKAVPRPQISGLPQDRQIVFDGTLNNITSDAKRKAADYKRGLLGSRAEAAFGSGVDELDVQAANPNRPIGELYGKLDAIGMGVQGFMAPDQFEKMKRNAQERLSLGRVNTLFKTAESPEQLDALATDITDQKYIMDSAKAANYLGQIETKKSQLLNRSDIEGGKRESAAASAVNKLQAAAVSPYPLDPAYEAELVQQTVGTESHGAAIAAVADKRANGMAQTMPLGKLKGEIEAFTNEALSIGTTDTAFVKSSVDRKNAIYNARLKIATSYPVEAIKGETGMEFEPLAFNDSPKLAAQIENRLSAVKAYSEQQGVPGIPLNPFTELEQGAIVELLDRSGDPAKMALVQSIAKASTSPAVFRQAMASVKQNSPTNYYAGELFMMVPNERVGANVMKQYYAGEKIRKEGTKPLVADGVLLGEFASRMGSAVDPDTDDYKSGLERFKRFYAEASVSDDKTIVDTDAAERAFSLATGGVTEFGGGTVVKPWGIRSEEFAELAVMEVRRVNIKHGLGIEDPQDVELDGVPGFNGVYTIVGADGFPRMDKQKNPIQVRISNK